MKRPTYDHITATATEINSAWSAKDKLLFQCFNPNGAIAKKRALDEKISEAVSAGKCASGAIFAYGTLNAYHHDSMMKTVMKRRVSPADYRIEMSGINRDIESAEKFLAGLVSPRELFEACQGDVPLSVMNVCGEAADNAAATINENGGKFVQGEFTDEFIRHWYGSVQCIICDSDWVEQEAREWLEARGVKY